MKIALHDCDSKMPNLALMKLSAYHKLKGDHVEWFLSYFKYDKIYSSKVFSYTPLDSFLPDEAIKGGSGYSLKTKLVDNIEHICPDYSLYKMDYSMGFTTRGCHRKCKFCIVPEKEGLIIGHAEIDEFTRHKKLVLLDNNILASEHGIQQLEKVANKKIKLDLNQGMDIRILANDKALINLIKKIKWVRFIRFAFDSIKNKKAVLDGIDKLLKAGIKPYRLFFYCLIDDLQESLERINILRSFGVDVFAQPFIDFKTGKIKSSDHKRMARWVNHKAIFKTTPWENYK